VSTTARPQRWELFGGLLLGALFLLPLLQAGPVDNEEIALGIFSSQTYYQALFHGRSPFWLNDLGFGTPMPIGQRLDFHPIFALGSLVSLRVALSAVWLVHVAVMVVYFLRLAAASGIRPPMRMFLLVCYLFSASTINYFYLTDWLSVQIAWTLYPVLVYYVREVVTGEGRGSFWFQTIRLGLVFGVFILNSHPGYIAPLVIVLGVYVIAAAPGARARACLLAAALLAAAVSAERAFFALSEMLQFPPGLPREAQAGYGLLEYARTFVAPLASVDSRLRLPFIGLVLGGCAVAAVLRVPRTRDPHTRACAIAFLAALALSVAPLAVVVATRAISGGWLFRDPMLFFGLLAGGLVLQRMYESRAWRPAVWALVALQLVQQTATIRPGVVAWQARAGQLQFYRHQGQAEGLGRLLADRAGRFGKRLYVSEEVRTLMRGSLSAQGIHVLTDLVFLGIDPINGWFKSVSMDRLYPSPALMHGVIEGQREVVENGALLDVLGIDLVLAAEGGVGAPDGLVVTDRAPVAGGAALTLFANPEAWPTAVLMTADTQHVTLPLRPGCSHDRAMCRDYSSLLDRRLPAPVSLRASDGVYVARFSAADQERLLFVSATYRPEWRARAGAETLRVDPVAGAFLGVTVPPGVEEVDMTFVPRTRIALAGVSGSALAAEFAALGVAWWRRRAGIDRDDT
jgi:hypothetical protein